MSNLGVLFLFGANSKPISVDEQRPFHIDSHELYGEAKGANLLIFTVKSTSNKQEMYEAKKADIANEITQREKDIVAVSADIAKLQAAVELADDGAETAGQELIRMLGVRGNHQRRIAALREMKEVTYSFKEKQERLSLLLRDGIATNAMQLLPSIQFPLVWCPAPAAAVTRTTEELTKEGSGPPSKTVSEPSGLVLHNALTWVPRFGFTISNHGKTFTRAAGCGYWHIYSSAPPMSSGTHRFQLLSNLMCYGAIGVTSNPSLPDGLRDASCWCLAVHPSCEKQPEDAKHVIKAHPSLYTADSVCDVTVNIDSGSITFAVAGTPTRAGQTSTLAFPAATRMYFFVTSCHVGTATLADLSGLT